MMSIRHTVYATVWCTSKTCKKNQPGMQGHGRQCFATPSRLQLFANSHENLQALCKGRACNDSWHARWAQRIWHHTAGAADLNSEDCPVMLARSRGKTIKILNMGYTVVLQCCCYKGNYEQQAKNKSLPNNRSLCTEKQAGGGCMGTRTKQRKVWPTAGACVPK